MAEEREKKRKKSHANGGSAPEPAPARSTQEMKAGELLRHVREEKGMELEEISSAIHVRVVQLRAIEEGHIESLPGMTYALGFVKSYASYLKLDPVSVANKFKQEHSVAPAKPDLKFPEPMSEHKMPDMFMIGAAVAGVAVLLGVWFFFSGGEEKTVTNVATAIPAPPSDIAPLTAGSAATAETSGAATPPASATSATTSASTTPAASTTAAAPAAVTTTAAATTITATATANAPAVPVATAPGAKPVAAETAVTAKPASPAAAVAAAKTVPATDRPATTATEGQKPAATASADANAGQKNAVINIRPRNGRVMVVATQSAWVQVTDPSGNVLLKQVLRPGDRYVVPDERGLKLLTSNAGGIKLYVDGEQSAPVGQSGEIVRGVSLNPDALKHNAPTSHRATVHD